MEPKKHSTSEVKKPGTARVNDKIIVIGNDSITVKTEQMSQFPPSFKIHAEHPSGSFHEESITIGDADLSNVPSVQEAQKSLDDARQRAATMAHRKATISSLASQLK